MRLLIITYCYPPDLNPRAFRWGALTQHWANQGHQVDVVCGPNRTMPKSAGLTVHSVGGNFLTRQIKKWKSDAQASNSTVDAHSHKPSRRVRVAGFLRSLHDHTWKRAYWPDYACLWYFAAKKQARALLETQHYDALITVSNPYTSHLVGLALRRRYSDLQWLVDIGDPFSVSTEIRVNNGLYRPLNRAAETKVFAQADVISVTTTTTANDYAAAFLADAAKIRVIHPLSSTNQPADHSPPFFTSGTRRRIVFAGRLYRDIRNPAGALAAFNRLFSENEADIELHFFGPTSECEHEFAKYRDLIGTRLFLHGEVGRVEVQRALSEADVLLNIGNSTRSQLPSKLIEYVATAKPIINFTSRSDDSSAQFLAAYPNALNISSTEVNDEATFDAFARFAKTAKMLVDRGPVESMLQPYSLNAVSAAYQECLRATPAHD